MRFEHRRLITGGASPDPDPRVDPGGVPDTALSRASLNLRASDTILKRILFAAEGTTGQSVSVDVYALDDQDLDRQAGFPERPTQAAKAARRWYLVAAGLTVNVGELSELLTVIPTAGTVYFRVAGAPAADATLLAAFAP